MLVRVFTLRFDPILDRFDDGEVRDFIKDKEMLSIRDHFFVKEEIPHLAMVLTYNLLRPEVETSTPAPRPQDQRREKWRELLEEPDWPLFNTLRDWRNQQVREEGIPPYVICSNRQLAAIAHDRPASLSKLGMVEGLGRAKLERYGGFILKIVEPEKRENAGDERSRTT
jgi:ATP-dependent DNA helicase RecQ